MTTIEMIKNLALRSSVVASADVLAVFRELEAKDERIIGLERHVKDIEATLMVAADEVADLTKERDEARTKLATPVRLPTRKAVRHPAGYPEDAAREAGYNEALFDVGEALDAQGFTVEGDE
ncbi:hypothetical protein OSC18_26550 [Serratia nevei]|uniref:hypothetical protein n=1 Tax=Serratia nevei TaxID=2703794 RepID=UPI00285E25C2|nr:hypothetical protein [Serratia nevei]MDR8493036.1 hypothetical protein [Serratia nevei]